MPLPIVEALDRRADECWRASLAAGYREIASAVRELWPLSPDPDPLAPRLTERLALLDALSGHPAPTGILSAHDVLAIAGRRSLMP